MHTNELIKEIQKLPLRKRIYLVEKTIQSIRKSEEARQMEFAAESLVQDYKTDSELTAFTDLDFEKFYETR
jgi:hypothetical protein